MEAFLDAKDLLKITNGEEKCPIVGLVELDDLSEQEKKQVVSSTRKDKLAKFFLFQVLSDSQLLHVSTLFTSYEIWAKFAQLYESRRMGTKMYLKQQLMNLRMGEKESMTAYISTFQSLVDQLKSLGVELFFRGGCDYIPQQFALGYEEFIAMASAFLTEDTCCILSCLYYCRRN
eukprot:c24418_g1_i1 orf=1392-1916(+)